MITYGSTTLTSYNTITKIEVYYYKSTSATSLSGGSWSTTKPTWENGKYIWQKIRTTYEGKLENGQYYSESDPVNITGQQGQQGETGASAYSYKLNVSDTIISVSKNGTYSTNSVTFSATSKQGNEDINPYEGRFKIETTMDGITWTTQYTSSANESSKTFTIPSDISNIRCSLYQAGGTTVLLDITSVSIVRDGIDGALYPNLSPFFSHDLTDVYNAETNPNGYWIEYSSYGWTKNSNFIFTQLEDGWLHVHIDNSSGTSVIRNDCCIPRYNPSIKKGTMYTFLTEFRNNQSTGLDETSNFYLVQQSGGVSVQFWGINTTTAPSEKLDGIGGVSIRVIDIPSDGSYAIARGTKYSESEDSASHWTTEDAMVTFTFRANAGAVIDYDIRLSVYEGEYWGNYVPYIISDVTDIRNSAETANNRAEEANNKIDNLEIGGRNLLRNTEKITANKLALSRASVPENGIIRITPTGSAGYCKFCVDYLDYINYEGITFTASMDVRIADIESAYTTTNNLIVYFGVNIASRINSIFTSSYDRYSSKTFTGLTSQWQRFSFSFTIPDDLKTGKTSALVEGSQITIQISEGGSRSPIDVRLVKLEKGNKPTDWTPAPEDVEEEISTLRTDLQSQIDEKIQTFYQSTNPASSWTTTELRTPHDGDLWYYTGTTTSTYTKDNVYRYNASNNTWSVYSASGELFDKVDGKSTIYYGTTSDTYTGVETGDYLVDSTDGSSYRWDGSEWVKVTDYKTTITNAIDDIEIGGRNLLRFSEKMDNWNLGTNSSNVDGEVTVIGSSSNWDGKVNTLKMNSDLLDGETKYLLSFDYKSIEDIIPVIVIAGTSRYIEENEHTRTKYTNWINSITLPSTNGEWKRFTLPSRTISISDLTVGSGDVNSWYLQFYNHNDTTVVVKRFKLERGNKATDWTPAPEDITRGTGFYAISTAPTTYTTPTHNFNPSYRIALTTVKTESGLNEVMVGDVIQQGYNTYPVGYVDDSYVYLGAINSIRGATGAAGLNTARVILYRRFASAPTGTNVAPTGDVTYTFATGIAANNLNSWTQNIPSGIDPVYMIVASASNTGETDTIPKTEWSTPVKILENGQNGSPGNNGLDGYNQATIYLYQRASSIPNQPTSEVMYTFSSGALSPTPSGWYRTIPENNGNPCYVITATAIAKTSTYTIQADDWSDVVVLSQDGENGRDGINGTSQNLLLDVYATSLTKVKAPWSRYISDSGNTTITGEFIPEDNLPDPNATHFIRFTDSSATTKGRALCFYSGGTPPFLNGHTYKVGCWVRKHAGQPRINIYLGGVFSWTNTKTITNTEWEWVECVHTFGDTDPSINAQPSTYKRLYFYFYNKNVEGSSLDMCGFKAEEIQTNISTARNYLLKTKKLEGWGVTNGTTINDGIATFPEVTANTWREVYSAKNFKYELIRNKNIIFSVKVKADMNKICCCNLCIGVDSTETAYARQKYALNPMYFTGTADWQTICLAVPMSDEYFTSGSETPDYDNCWVTVRIGAYNNYWNGFQIKEPQLSLGTTATAWSVAPEDVSADIQQVQNNLDNLEIGGRNLIIGTLNPIATGGTGIYRPHLPGQITNTSGRGTCTVAEHGLRFTNTTANWEYIYFGSSSDSAEPCMLGLEAGQTYTLSADLSWKILSSDTGKANTTTYYMGGMLAYSTEANLNSFTTATSNFSLPITQSDKGTEMSGKLIFTFTVPSDAIRLYLGIRANNTTASHYAIGDYLEAKNLKLEKGSKATDWSPAPEDMQDGIDTALAQSIWYATCDSPSAALTKEATITPAVNNFTLNIGATVNVKFENGNTGDRNNLKLNINDTGDKDIRYMNNATIAVLPNNTYIVGGGTYLFVYDGTYWVIQNLNYNTNDNYYDRRQHKNNITAKTAITAKHLIVGNSTGYQQIASTSGGTLEFDLGYPILWAYSDIAATKTSTATYEAYPSVNFSTSGTIQNGATNKMLWLKGTIRGNIFTLASTNFLTTQIPTSDDGMYYIPLGIMSSATAGYFSSSNRIYAYIDEEFQPLDNAAALTAIKARSEIVQTQQTLSLQIRDISVGGANLFERTKTFEGTANQSTAYDSFTEFVYKDLTVKSANTVTFGNQVVELSAYQYTDLTSNMWYSFSFYAKGNVDIGFMYAGTGNAVIDSIDVSWDDNTYTGFNTTSTSSNIIWLTPTNNWQRYSVVFHIEEQDITALHRLIGLYARPVNSYTELATDNKDILITETGTDVHLIMEGNEVQICGYKLELGNKPTDWTPADNDKATYDNIISQINLSKEGIAIRADKIRLEGMITANEGFSIDEDGNMTAKNGKFNGLFESYATEINENTFDIKISNGHIHLLNNEDRTLSDNERHVGYIGGGRNKVTYVDGTNKNNDAIDIRLDNGNDFMISAHKDWGNSILYRITNHPSGGFSADYWCNLHMYDGNRIQMYGYKDNQYPEMQFYRYSKNTSGYLIRGSLSLHSVTDNNSEFSDRLYLWAKNQGNDLVGDQWLHFTGKGLKYTSGNQPLRTGYVATDKYIVTQYFSLPDLTIVKNTSQNFTIDVSRDGYTPIMCIPKVGGGQNAFYLSIYTWSMSGNIVTIRTHNNSSTSDVSNVTISLQVLYKLTY